MEGSRVDLKNVTKLSSEKGRRENQNEESCSEIKDTQWSRKRRSKRKRTVNTNRKNSIARASETFRLHLVFGKKSYPRGREL